MEQGRINRCQGLPGKSVQSMWSRVESTDVKDCLVSLCSQCPVNMAQGGISRCQGLPGKSVQSVWSRAESTDVKDCLVSLYSQCGARWNQQMPRTAW